MIEPSKSYRHVQIGYVTRGVVLPALFLVGIISRSFLRDAPPGLPRLFFIALMGTVALLLISCAIVFSTLTINVRDGWLAWYFTGRVLGRAVALREIEEIVQTQTPAAYGWGFRSLPDGRLYNVSGLKAVSVKLRDGRRYVLGSDDPANLAQTIESAAR